MLEEGRGRGTRRGGEVEAPQPQVLEGQIQRLVGELTWFDQFLTGL